MAIIRKLLSPPSSISACATVFPMYAGFSTLKLRVRYVVYSMKVSGAIFVSPSFDSRSSASFFRSFTPSIHGPMYAMSHIAPIVPKRYEIAYATGTALTYSRSRDAARPSFAMVSEATPIISDSVAEPARSPEP